MIPIDICRAQSLPSHEARVPPSQSWASAKETHCQSPGRDLNAVGDLEITCHGPWYRCNKTRSVFIDVIVFHELLVGQNNRHDPCIIPVEAG